MNVFDHIIPNNWEVGIGPLTTVNKNQYVTFWFFLFINGYHVMIESDRFDLTQKDLIDDWKKRYTTARTEIESKISSPKKDVAEVEKLHDDVIGHFNLLVNRLNTNSREDIGSICTGFVSTINRLKEIALL